MRTRAFTLVELLVVVAVAALLLSLMAPALAAAFRGRHQTACLALLRGVGQRFALYRDGHAGAAPGYPADLVDEPSPADPCGFLDRAWACPAAARYYETTGEAVNFLVDSQRAYYRVLCNPVFPRQLGAKIDAGAVVLDASGRTAAAPPWAYKVAWEAERKFHGGRARPAPVLWEGGHWNASYLDGHSADARSR